MDIYLHIYIYIYIYIYYMYGSIDCKKRLQDEISSIIFLKHIKCECKYYAKVQFDGSVDI